MQVLKDDIKNAITEASLNEFYKNGYENTSMRTIAKKANITVGNLYRYFKNKEKIFEFIVNPAVNKLIQFSQKHLEIHESFRAQGLSREETHEEFIKFYTELFLNYRKELIILLEGSKNTKYANIKEHVVELLTSNVMEHFKEIYPKRKLKSYIILARSLAISLLEGSSELIKNCKNDKEIIELTREFFGFYSVLVEKFI